MNIRKHIENTPVDWKGVALNPNFYRKQPHFIKGTRFGQKEMLGLWSSRENYGNFHVMYGIAKESIGKLHFANNVCSDSFVYYWGDYCHNKMIRPKCNYHIGAAPFFYAHLLNSRENIKRKGTVVYLPRTDNRVTFSQNSEVFLKIKEIINNAEKPVTVLSYFDCPNFWEEKLGVKVKILSYDVVDAFWQMRMSELFLKHKYAYIPNICSDFFYAVISGCKPIYYDAMSIYEHVYGTSSIIPSYHKDKVTPVYHKVDNILKNLFTGGEINEEQFYFSCRMLSVDSSECSEDLAVTMERLSASKHILCHKTDAIDTPKRHFTPIYASQYRSQFKVQEEAESLRKKIIEDYKSIKNIDYIDEIMLEL